MDSRQNLERAEYTENAEFVSDDLSGIDLSKKEFYKVIFKNCRLAESNWERARLESCQFEGCDMTRVKLRYLGALGVSFKNCKLMGVEWADLSAGSQMDFEECNLRYASFLGANLRRTSFLRCRINEANFIDCDLTEADFSGAELTSTLFRGCQLRLADFSRATGVFLDPSITRVKDVKIATDAAVRLAVHMGMRVPEWENDRQS